MEPDKSSPLVSLALDGIARLDGDDAKEDALKTLGNVLAGTTFAPELAEVAFERLLRLSLSLEAPWTRARAFADACESIGCSRAPRELRATVLERALGFAEQAETPLERIDRARAATQALGALRRDEEVVERLERLGAAAAALGDVRARARTLVQIALAMADAGEQSRAVALLDQLAPSASRGRALALVARQMHAAGAADEAIALVEATVGEIRAEPESYEQALALRAVLEVLLETGMVLRGGSGVGTVLAIVDELHDARFKKDALLGVIEALPKAALDPEQLTETNARLRASVDRVEETYTRAPLLGELAIALAARGDVEGAARALDGVLKIATGSDPTDLVDALGDPEAALPIPKILSALASRGDARAVHQFAMHALAMIRGVDEPATIASIIQKAAHLFASPALPYDSRIALLDRALWVAQSLRSPDHCVEAVTAVANALSLAGATERGDCLFAGLVIAIDPRLARKAHLERAIALTRLGRVPDAREQLVAAAELPGGDTWHAIEELARACARCGFIGDLLDVLARIEPERQLEARTQIADVLAESAYLDPALRVIGLESIANKAEPPVADTVAVLIEEVKLVERMGDPGEILARGFVRTGAMEKRATAAALEQQLVGALLDRLRRDETS
jgi:tetratricopeptide (TPR) repeat protein